MLRLRPYKKCDAKRIVTWCKNEEDNFYPMKAFDESGAVGHFIIRYLHGDNRILRFGWVIVDDSKRGGGYGKEMLSLGLKYAFEITY